MIQRIRFLDDADPAPARASLDAPAGARPVAVTWSTARHDLVPDPPHAAIAVEVFADAAHLDRFEAWAPPADPRRTVVAERHVLRGEAWLAARWRDGGPRLKHVAVAHRAPGLTPEAFLARWRAHAGTAGGRAIPVAARGAAYAQDHPVAGRPGAYDAVNEVWFDGEPGLRARLAWFAANPPVPDALFGASRFLAVREDLLSP